MTKIETIGPVHCPPAYGDDWQRRLAVSRTKGTPRERLLHLDPENNVYKRKGQKNPDPTVIHLEKIGLGFGI